MTSLETYEVKYTVGGNAAAKIASIASSPTGPLQVSREHIYVKIVGGFSPGTAVCTIGLTYLEYLCLDNIIFDDALDRETKQWYATPARWSNLFKALAEKGIPTDCVNDINAAREVFNEWILKLSDAERTFEHADMQVDTADTTDWMDQINPAKVRKTDRNQAVFTQMRSLLPGLWTEAGRREDAYKNAANEIINERVDTSTAPLPRQAAAVIQWLRNTRMPANLTIYIPPDEAPDELQRRLSSTEEEKYLPLFEAGWSRAFPELTEIYDKTTEGATVASLLKALFLQVGLPHTTLTPETAKSFVDMAREKLKMLKLPSLETSIPIDEANERRSAAFITAVGGKLTRASSGDYSDRKDSDDKVDAHLLSQPDFAELIRGLDLQLTTPIDGKAVFKLLCKSPSAAGLLAIAGKKVDTPQFKSFRGVSIDKTTLHAEAYVKEILNFDSSDNARPQWPAPLSVATIKKFIYGQVRFGKGTDAIDYWQEFKQLITMREGAHHVQSINDIWGEPTQHLWIFLMPEHQELMRRDMLAMFTMIGYGGTAPGGFDATWRNITKRTKAIYKIPFEVASRMGLLISHVKACALIFDTFADSIKAMHASPVSVAVKPRLIISSGGPAADAWTEVGNKLAEIIDQLQTESGHLSKRQRFEVANVNEAVDNVPEFLLNSEAGKQVCAYFGWTEKKPDKYNSYEDDGSYRDIKRDTDLPEHITSEWGGQAYRNGVCACKDFKTIWFGNERAVTLEDGCPLPKKGDCLANWYLTNNEWNRDKWCCCPTGANRCKKGSHKLTDGVKWDENAEVKLAKEMPDKPADVQVIVAKSKPGQGGSPSASAGRPRGGTSGGSSKGGGWSSSGGKGKPGKGSKGGKGVKGAIGKSGKGKGRGGKGKGSGGRTFGGQRH
jgi:hypothetical protein